MGLPKSMLVKRGHILNSGLGITRRMLDKVIECGALKPVKPMGIKRALFRRADVVKVFQLEET